VTPTRSVSEGERQVRAEAAALASAWQEQGVPALEIADLLDCPLRTLRHWQHQCLAGCGQARPLSRPHLHCTKAQSRAVIGFLHGHGPWVGSTVWAMDFTKAKHPIDGIYPYLFAVRDLASGLQLTWRPVPDLEAATAQAEGMAPLFTTG
jgi:hypothetical protein